MTTRNIHLIIAVLSIASFLSDAFGAELIVGSTNGTPGQEIAVPLSIKPADSLAGLKLMLGYDSEILEFTRADKSPAAASMIHVVNNREPGRLIIVMAGATGIQGQHVALLSLVFKIREQIRTSMRTYVHLLDVEAKSDQLKTIPISIHQGEIEIKVVER